MADLRKHYTLKINHEEALSLKKILGSMNDAEFSAKGVHGNSRELIRNIWEMLPYEDEDLLKI